MSNSDTLAQICGCFVSLPKFIDDEFIKVGLRDKNRCDFFCFQSEAYKLFHNPGDTSNQEALDCDDANICILSKHNVDLNNNRGGRIRFEQICTCPKGQLCLCFL